jgi:hypothetical protein
MSAQLDKLARCFSFDFRPSEGSERGDYYGVVYECPYSKHARTSVEIEGSESLHELFDEAERIARRLLNGA